MVGPENTENKVICIFLWWIVNKMQVFSSQNICLLTPSAKKTPNLAKEVTASHLLQKQNSS